LVVVEVGNGKMWEKILRGGTPYTFYQDLGGGGYQYETIK